jgi:hypothetical protein
MTRYQLYGKMGGTQGLSGWVRKISLLSGIRTPDRAARSKSLYRLSYSARTPRMKVLNPNVVWQWYPEHVGRKFFRNIGISLSNYVASHPSKPNMNIHRCKNLKSHKLEETWSTKLSRPKSSLKTLKTVIFRHVSKVEKTAYFLRLIRPVCLSVCLSVRQSACVSAAPTGQISVNFDSKNFYKNLLSTSKFG